MKSENKIIQNSTYFNIIKRKTTLIITLIIGILIGSTISVYATYKFLAKDVKYSKENGQEISVEEALNELYNKNLLLLNREVDVASGTTINVEPGTYILVSSVVGATVTNSECIYENVYGGECNGITSATSLHRATGTSVTISTGSYRLSYYIFR